MNEQEYYNFLKTKSTEDVKKIKYELYMELKELKKDYSSHKKRIFVNKYKILRILSNNKIVNPFDYKKYSDKKEKYKVVKKYIKSNKL